MSFPLTISNHEPMLCLNPTEIRRGCDRDRSSALAPTSAVRFALPDSIRPVVRVLSLWHQLAEDAPGACGRGMDSPIAAGGVGRPRMVANRSSQAGSIRILHRPQLLVAARLRSTARWRRPFCGLGAGTLFLDAGRNRRRTAGTRPRA